MKLRAISTYYLVAFALSAAVSAAADQAAVPLQKAQGENLSAAIGHFARSRSLIIAAINEFDQGLKLVNPDALMDAQAWRDSLAQRAKEIEHVLDPQPRASRGGVRYDADTRLLGEATKR
ncbi:MAG: hypothetical protein K1X83_15050 [Oligoflexia bacterium]|nr:hypothetical protein [Oligoflexia bacterium]